MWYDLMHQKCDWNWRYSCELIGVIIRAKATAFTRSAITPPKVNRFVWNLELCEAHVGYWPWQNLGAIRSVATVWEGSEISFFVMRITHGFCNFPSDKFYDISTQQRRSVSPCKLSEQNYENFITRVSFFRKTQKLLKNFPVLATLGSHNSAMITKAENSRLSGPLALSIFIFTVIINSIFLSIGCTLRTGSTTNTRFCDCDCMFMVSTIESRDTIPTVMQ